MGLQRSDDEWRQLNQGALFEAWEAERERERKKAEAQQRHEEAVATMRAELLPVIKELRDAFISQGVRTEWTTSPPDGVKTVTSFSSTNDDHYAYWSVGGYKVTLFDLRDDLLETMTLEFLEQLKTFLIAVVKEW